MTARATPRAGALIWTLIWTMMALTWTRLRRGKALWIGALIAAVPSLYAGLRAASHGEVGPSDVMYATTPVIALIPPLFVALSIAEELESRTCTYLWSRPIARWAVLAGKLGALVPVVITLVAGGWIAASWLGGHALPSAISCAAIAAGCAAISLVATGIATLAPRHGMALAISYLLVDAFIGLWPFSLAELSLTHQLRVLARIDGGPPSVATPVIAMAVIAAIWAAVAVLRIRRVEA